MNTLMNEIDLCSHILQIRCGFYCW